jgi:hypothetical protein
MTVLTPHLAVAAKRVATTAAPVASGLTVTQAIGIFVGIPALLVLLITAAVYASTGGSRRRHAAWSRLPVDHIGGARPSGGPGKAGSVTDQPSPAPDRQPDAAGPAGATSSTGDATRVDAGAEAASPRPTEETA